MTDEVLSSLTQTPVASVLATTNVESTVEASEVSTQVEVQQVETSLSTVVVQSQIITNEIVAAFSYAGERGPAGEGVEPTFETVSKNLKAYPYTLTQPDDDTILIVYDLGEGITITKTLALEEGDLQNITLSGSFPEGISLVKNIVYVDGEFAGVSYT